METEQAVTIPEFPVVLDPLAQLIQHYPAIAVRFLVDLVYPYPLLPTTDGEQRRLIDSLYQRFSLDTSPDSAQLAPWSRYRLVRLERRAGNDGTSINAAFAVLSDAPAVEATGDAESAPPAAADAADALSLRLCAGPRPSMSAEFFVDTNYHSRVVTALLQTHTVGDFCLVGTKGVGKSALVRQFAHLLGYRDPPRRTRRGRAPRAPSTDAVMCRWRRRRGGEGRGGGRSGLGTPSSTFRSTAT